jgi:multiple sugar transport system substrate-binding protein
MFKSFAPRPISAFAIAGAALCAVAIGTARADEQTVLKVAYSSDFVPVTPEAGKAWWTSMAEQFQKEHPNVKVEYTTIAGSYADLENKLSLLFRSPSTAPDVAEISNLDIGPWVASGYFLSLNDRVAKAPWWAGYAASVKAETTLDGQVYAVSHGENTMALMYDKKVLAKAGVPLPYQPKGWPDLLETARKIKATSPGVWPLWVSTGTAQGVFGVETGPGVLLLGSSDPTVYDEKTQKWVVDSPGLRQVIAFYKQASSEGLLAPSSQLLNATAIATPPVEMSKGHMGLILGGNWFSDQWAKALCAPCWPQAAENIAVTPFPTFDGHAPNIASTLGGWDLAIYAKTKHADLAWAFIDLTQRKANLLGADIEGGWVPPITTLASDKEFSDFEPPFREQFAKLMPYSVGVPSNPDYPVWANGVLQATEAVVLDPKLSVDDAIGKLSDYVSNQLGPDKIETRK